MRLFLVRGKEEEEEEGEGEGEEGVEEEEEGKHLAKKHAAAVIPIVALHPSAK